MTNAMTASNDLLTLAEIQVEIDKLPDLMSAKGCVTPSAEFALVSGARARLMLKNRSSEGAQVGSYGMDIFAGDTPREIIESAIAHIAAMPDPETAATQRFVKKMADAVDQARKDGVPDEYTAPVSAHIKVVYENLLPAPADRLADGVTA
ncbi:hypothetical protein AN189_17500 [Loktanella sp. 3ANDIMAR09]|uniref:hypothetical protein n=1 Tax=Loktanella sp. 3ANDIMAR09 TaxID=1225657 RepID=UPI000701EBED|nr:hypothetical protein [Loktanella sp. 3ANDIMAR09]KQI67021.1 hypothetical protein AN189_17500 [Loktanella sp. 3ANDIMAR09]